MTRQFIISLLAWRESRARTAIAISTPAVGRARLTFGAVCAVQSGWSLAVVPCCSHVVHRCVAAPHAAPACLSSVQAARPDPAARGVQGHPVCSCRVRATILRCLCVLVPRSRLRPVCSEEDVEQAIEVLLEGIQAHLERHGGTPIASASTFPAIG